jgi:hypothetical protein
MTQDDYNEYAEGYEAGKEAAQETGLSNTAPTLAGDPAAHHALGEKYGVKQL